MEDRELLPKLVKTDLNLLTTLYALLEEGSTQGAALRLGRTQSAASHALGRLRELFNDPLFVRHGPKLTATPLALRLHQPLIRLLNDATSLIETGTGFDPKTTDRQIVLAGADICLSQLTKIADQLLLEAPDLRIRMDGPRHGTTRLLNGEIDLLLSLYRVDFPTALDATSIGKCDWCVFARSGHPISKFPTPEEWATYGHVQVGTGPSGRNPISDAANLAGVQRTVRMQVATFLEALHIAAKSDLLFTIIGGLIADHASILGLQALPVPFPVPSVPLTLAVRQTNHDPLNHWLNSQAQVALDLNT